MDQTIDIKENFIYDLDKELLEILLKDRSSKKNIIWATDNYENKGKGYQFKDHISVKAITGKNGLVIKPRTKKSKKEQEKRIKEKAEVFTPSWICNNQNNVLCDAWFNRRNVFNKECDDNTWETKKEKIEFPNDKTRKDFVSLKVLEITCGEAPYLVSRYDTVTGEWLNIENRIGALDRKIRIINENVNNEDEWLIWTKEAFQSTFGYEWQGDSVLIARENLLFTFIDYYTEKFNKKPSIDTLKEIAHIISWNIWQMDGLKYVIPLSCHKKLKNQLSLFEDEEEEECPGCKFNKNDEHNGIYSRIMNWKTNHSFKFYKGEKRMKFDFVIGNPPYQESISKTENQTQGNSNYVYQYFQFAADKIGKTSCLIYPFGGWFDAPNRLGGLGNKILNDKHTIFIHAYEGTPDRRAWYRSDKNPEPLFGNNANLSAGVAIVMRDCNEHEFFEYSNRIYTDEKVKIYYDKDQSLSPNPLFIKINNKFSGERLSNHIKRGIFDIESDFVEKNPTLVSTSPDNFKEPVLLMTNDKSGSSGRTRPFYIERSNITKGTEYLDYYKVIMISAYPKQKIVSGKVSINNIKKRLNELIELLPPNSAFGRSRLALFMSKDKSEVDNFRKYTKTNFFAGLVLQEPNRRTAFGDIIPAQNYSNDSDIDWTKSIEEIDQQLYKKYNLTQEEIDFIEQKNIGENI